MRDAAATPILPEPTRPCACCKGDLPMSAFPAPTAKNCTACRERSAARRKTPKVPAPDGWKAPKPGETPLQRCEVCETEKVLQAFEAGSPTCRQCVADARQPPAPKVDDGKRPTVYTPELGAIIAEQIAGGATLKAIAARPDMPSKDALARWRLENEDLAAMLATARQARADSRADEIADLVEAVRSGVVDPHAGRVAIDGLRWLASKDAPRTYGDKVELSNPDGSLKAQISTATAIEALIASLPDLVGTAPKELLPPPPLSGGAAEVARFSSDLATSITPGEPASSPRADEEDLTADDEDGYETPHHPDRGQEAA